MKTKIPKPFVNPDTAMRASKLVTTNPDILALDWSGPERWYALGDYVLRTNELGTTYHDQYVYGKCGVCAYLSDIEPENEGN
jgi:hypothetical protein